MIGAAGLSQAGGSARAPNPDDLNPDDGPVKDVNPEVAAKKRAARRQEARARHAAAVVGGGLDFEDDIAEAEEEDPDEVRGGVGRCGEGV